LANKVEDFDPRDIDKGKVHITVASKEGKEGVIAILEPGNFSAKDALPVNRCIWRPQVR
jgi:hypothetical protein